jgi:hypothetical protein
VFGLGLSQVVLTMPVVAGNAALAAVQLPTGGVWEMGWQTARWRCRARWP